MFIATGTGRVAAATAVGLPSQSEMNGPLLNHQPARLAQPRAHPFSPENTTYI